MIHWAGPYGPSVIVKLAWCYHAVCDDCGRVRACVYVLSDVIPFIWCYIFIVFVHMTAGITLTCKLHR